MSVPYRHDLDPNSYVNDEVEVYNRKLKKKHLKVFGNSHVIEVDSNRDLFTRHGLHMNSKGKEQMAKKIVKAIEVMLNKENSDPIMMNDKEEPGANSEGSETDFIPMETETKLEQLKKNTQAKSEHAVKQLDTLNFDNLCTRSSIRQKKAPITMSNDFVWQ